MRKTRSPAHSLHQTDLVCVSVAYRAYIGGTSAPQGCVCVCVCVSAVCVSVCLCVCARTSATLHYRATQTHLAGMQHPQVNVQLFIPVFTHLPQVVDVQL